MKKLLLLVMAFAIGGWAVPKPMESIENYNVLMVHGAYGSDQNYHKTVFEHVLDSIVDDAANVKLSTSPMLSASHNMNKNPVPLEQLENLAAASKRLDEGYDLPSAYDADNIAFEMKTPVRKTARVFWRNGTFFAGKSRPA
mgnify:CR=1 FL=1